MNHWQSGTKIVRSTMLGDSDPEYVEPKRFFCDKCDKSFTTAKGRNSHNTRSHGMTIEQTHSILREKHMLPLATKEESLPKRFRVEDPLNSNSWHLDLEESYGDENMIQPIHSRAFVPKLSSIELDFANHVFEQNLSENAAETWRKFSKQPLRSWRTIKIALEKEINSLKGRGSSYLGTKFDIRGKGDSVVTKNLVIENPRVELRDMLEDPLLTSPKTLLPGYDSKEMHKSSVSMGSMYPSSAHL